MPPSAYGTDSPQARRPPSRGNGNGNDTSCPLRQVSGRGASDSGESLEGGELERDIGVLKSPAGLVAGGVHPAFQRPHEPGDEDRGGVGGGVHVEAVVLGKRPTEVLEELVLAPSVPLGDLALDELRVEQRRQHAASARHALEPRVHSSAGALLIRPWCLEGPDDAAVELRYLSFEERQQQLTAVGKVAVRDRLVRSGLRRDPIPSSRTRNRIRGSAPRRSRGTAECAHCGARGWSSRAPFDPVHEPPHPSRSSCPA